MSASQKDLKVLQVLSREITKAVNDALKTIPGTEAIKTLTATREQDGGFSTEIKFE